jgi:hypothetical protein
MKASVCDAVLPGIIELMAISMLIGILNLLNSIFGVCFVIRNKIDVPNSHPRRSTKSLLSPDSRKSTKKINSKSDKNNKNNSPNGRKDTSNILSELEQSGI